MVLVNWTRGSELHFLLLLRDALEGVISRLVQTAGDLHPVISSIVGDITALGKLPIISISIVRCLNSTTSFV